jgi:hypothetical protein
MLTYKQLCTKALANTEVKAEYETLAEEFGLLHEFLNARAAQALTSRQARNLPSRPSLINPKLAAVKSLRHAA